MTTYTCVGCGGEAPEAVKACDCITRVVKNHDTGQKEWCDDGEPAWKARALAAESRLTASEERERLLRAERDEALKQADYWKDWGHKRAEELDQAASENFPAQWRAAKDQAASEEQIRLLIKTLEPALADLRHAYTHLKAERVKRQAELADGLLSPAIARIERALRLQPEGEKG